MIATGGDAGSVARVENAAFEQRNSHRPEVVRASMPRVAASGRRSGGGTGRPSIQNSDPLPSPVNGSALTAPTREYARQRGDLDPSIAGKRPRAARTRCSGRRPAVRAWLTGWRDGSRDPPRAGVKSAHEESRANQHHQRQRDLRHHQRAAQPGAPSAPRFHCVRLPSTRR